MFANISGMYRFFEKMYLRRQDRESRARRTLAQRMNGSSLAKKRMREGEARNLATVSREI